MTNEKALEIAKGRLGYATAQSLCDITGYWKVEKELFKTIVDALEKQIKYCSYCEQRLDWGENK